MVFHGVGNLSLQTAGKARKAGSESKMNAAGDYHFSNKKGEIFHATCSFKYFAPSSYTLIYIAQRSILSKHSLVILTLLNKYVSVAEND